MDEYRFNDKNEEDNEARPENQSPNELLLLAIPARKNTTKTQSKNTIY
jgi:hypothetical protein